MPGRYVGITAVSAHNHNLVQLHSLTAYPAVWADTEENKGDHVISIYKKGMTLTTRNIDVKSRLIKGGQTARNLDAPWRHFLVKVKFVHTGYVLINPNFGLLGIFILSSNKPHILTCKVRSNKTQTFWRPLRRPKYYHTRYFPINIRLLA